MVVRGPSGGYVRGGPFHSQNPEAGFVHTPGLKVVYPSTAEDAKGLMKAAIRDDDCVLFFEHKYLYRRIKAEMPAGDHVVPIGKARVAREGKDLSIITYAATVWKALEAAEQLEKDDGLSVEVIDLRSLAPLDDEAIQATVRKTNRVLIVHEDTRTGGMAGEITARINESSFAWLDAPVLRVTAHDVPLPYAPSLEDLRVAADRGHRARGAHASRRTDMADERPIARRDGGDERRRSALSWCRLFHRRRRLRRWRNDRGADCEDRGRGDEVRRRSRRRARRATGSRMRCSGRLPVRCCFPSMAISLLRRARRRAQNSERG